MKKLLLLLLLGLVPNLMMAQTAKAIWCAGNSTLYFTYDNTTYSAGGTYDGQTITNVYAVSGTGYSNYSHRPWHGIRTSVTNVVIASNFYQFKPTSLDFWFYECHNLSSITGSTYLNVSDVTSMRATFSWIYYGISTLDVSNWDTSKVTNMSGLFSGCLNLAELDVSGWDTSNVTTLQSTFSGCSSLTSLDVSNWDISNVTTLESTFSGCSSLTLLDVSKWNTRNVNFMTSTFSRCSSITSIDVSNWNTSNVTNMGGTFSRCSSITSIDVSNWNTSNVTNMGSTFSGCSSLTSLDVSNWNTSNVTNMGSTFSGCSSLTSLDVSSWFTSNVTSMSGTFSGCISLTSLDVSNWDTSNVIYMGSTFSGCSSLTSLDVSNWDTSNVTTLRETFYDCYSLTSLDVSNWDTSNVTTLYRTFSDCYSLTSIYVRNWNTYNVTDMGKTFYYCSNLISISFGKEFSMDNITEAEEFIFCCPKLRFVDFYESDDTDAITDINLLKVCCNRSGEGVLTIIYLPHGSQAVTDKVNVVYSYNGDETDLRCPHYYSHNEVDIELPREFKTNKAHYWRYMSSTYGSVVLPYDFTSNSDVQAFTLDEEHVGSMTFKNATTVPAHTPFAFKTLDSWSTAWFMMEDETGNFGITVQATRDTKDNPYTATTNLSGWTTKGYYAAQTVDDYSDAFYISGDKIYKADGPLTLYPHRVTFHGTWTQGTPGTGAKNLEIADMATCINPIDNSQLTIDNCYDLSGRKVMSTLPDSYTPTLLRKGIYIVNGHKVVIK